MKEIFNLSLRHIKNYYRDKAAVFFSFLSVIILLLIYFLFLGNMYNGIPFENSIDKTRFITGFTMGGILVVNLLTMSLGVIGTYVNDIAAKRINGMLVTPVKRYKLTISYFISTFLLTIMFTFIMFLAVYLYIGLNGYWYSFLTILHILGAILLFGVIAIPLIIFIISFVNSINAFGGVSSLVGTLIGFISGIYIPLSVLDPFTRNVASLLPFSHMAIYLKRLLIGEDILAKMPADVINDTSLNTLDVLGVSINYYILFGIFLFIASILLALAYKRINKKSVK